MSLLPLPVRTRLIEASKKPKAERRLAINEAYTWARTHYPHFFRDSEGAEPQAYEPKTRIIENIKVTFKDM